MTTGDPDPREAWRVSHTPRDPIGQRLKTISMLTRQIGRKIGESLGVNVTDMAAHRRCLPRDTSRSKPPWNSADNA